MVNERLTEDIVRDTFKSDPLFKSIKLEEQQSTNPIITKLLNSASKKGLGVGRPEFIITFKNNPQFLIVIECKASITKHESKNRDKYSEYAVDGVLLYASYLSKEFDVLAIAISGQNKKELKISHFLELRGVSNEPRQIFGDKLLSLESYISGYKQDNAKFKRSYDDLLEYSKKLNENLHVLKIKESDRSILISGILIALQDASFKAAYDKQQNPKHLAENLVNTIKQQLTSELTAEKAETLIQQYNFIKIHPILSKDAGKNENVLINLIKEIDKNINSFLKTYRYQDVLSQFYIEFLRYANDEKGLGIVLTPPHITDLATELAFVGKDDVVYDNCCGTGGFLISAMQKMIKEANGDEEKVKEIKKKQLVGIELQPNIYTLACSNMFIHGDGKSSLYDGSCFDPDITNPIKEKYKLTAGLLNPPYKDTKDDIEELEFVLNNLSMLEKGSYCVAIVPMQCALAQKGVRLELKKKLLKDNTLEAVFSMPDELFINSNVSVVTCIMVFKAHIPHPESYETYFGYWKDDGFVKKKIIGRADYFHKWEGIKKEWLSGYRNKNTVPGKSVKKHISAGDEWCAEAYMETDYSTLKKEDFEKEIKKYLIYKALEG